MHGDLKSDLFAFVEACGKVTRAEVFAEFDLVSKRVIESVITELAEARLIVAGPVELALTKRAPAAPSPPPVPAEVVAPVVKPPTCAEQILCAITPGAVLYPANFQDALGGKFSSGTVYQQLKRLATAGRIAHRRHRGYWLHGTVEARKHWPEDKIR